MITIIGTILIVIVTAGIGFLVDRKWAVIYRKKQLATGSGLALPGHAAGEAPATALEVTAFALEALRRKNCDASRGETDALADDTVTFDGRELLVVHARCRRCNRGRSTYVFVRN